MTKEMTTVAAPTLPGILPDVEIAATLRLFSTFHERRVVIINRMPTAAERQILSARLVILDEILQPLIKSTEMFIVSRPEKDGGGLMEIDARKMAKRLLGAFFGGYPSLLNADAPGLVTAYIADLRSIPIFALAAALDDIKHGRVRVRDKGGREMPLDKDWPPSSSRVYDQAIKAMTDADTEARKIRTILGPTQLAQPEMTAPERERSSAGIQRALADYHKKVAAVSADDIKVELERKTARDAETRRRADEMILGEYRRLGVEPIYAGDMLVTPSMARINNPARFARK